MTGYWKPLQFSFILHGIILFAVLYTTMPVLMPRNVIVVDFTMEYENPSLPDKSGAANISLPVESDDRRHDMQAFEPVLKLQQEVRIEPREYKNPDAAPTTSDAPDIQPVEAEKPAMSSGLSAYAANAFSAEFSGYGAKSGINDTGLVHRDFPGPAEGGGAAGSSDKTLYVTAHFAYIKDLIHRHLVYPAKARKMGWEGKVITSFIVSSGGNVRDVRISKSSGYRILDDNAVKAVKDASPFPKPPVEAQIIIPILYRLN